MGLNPPEHAFITANGPININMFGITQSYATGSLFEGYRSEAVDGIDVDGLENGLRPAENDSRISGDVSLQLGSGVL